MYHCVVPQYCLFGKKPGNFGCALISVVLTGKQSSSYRQLQTADAHASSKKQHYARLTITLKAFPIHYGDLQSLMCLGLQLQVVHCGLQDEQMSHAAVH